MVSASQPFFRLGGSPSPAGKPPACGSVFEPALDQPGPAFGLEGSPLAKAFPRQGSGTPWLQSAATADKTCDLAVVSCRTGQTNCLASGSKFLARDNKTARAKLYTGAQKKAARPLGPATGSSVRGPVLAP